MTTLKKALQENKLEDFIKEHEQDNSGDVDKINSIISCMVEKKKSNHQTSNEDVDENYNDTQTR
jgi:hypothetical protein